MARALAASPSCAKLWCAPGNPGTAQIAETVAIDPTDADQVLTWCLQHNPTLVVVGPEQPLAAGVTDALRGAKIDVFGPSKAASQLETSKGYAKDFMRRHGIPTASYERFSEKEEAIAYLVMQSAPIVIKYDGLAAGKGVVVAETMSDAIDAVISMFDGTYGSDGVVIEKFLTGVEASILAICDGNKYVPLAPAHDHKRIANGNTGKNTGGMGAVAPSARVTPEILSRVCTEIIEPTLQGMQAEQSPFIGCLYCGIMIDAGGNPSVVEYNTRFGDPETQVVLEVLRADLARLFASAARGNVDTSSITNVCQGAAACVVLASQGYPDSYQTGMVITGLDEAEELPGVTVFHAGTKKQTTTDTSANSGTTLHYEHEVTVAAGGRVLGVTAHATELEEAIGVAYQAVDRIQFDGKYYRTDIGTDA